VMLPVSLPEPEAVQQPNLRDPIAQDQFRAAVRGYSLDPDNPWVGGCVDSQHWRQLLECSGVAIAGAKVLEFGCYVGATCIALGSLGASVTAVDNSNRYVELARLNAACYGLEQSIEFVHIPDTRRLPFADGQFDLIICNSVLEYVSHGMLGAVQCELDRVLRPGGTIVIEGTSNRLSPWEVHSKSWFVNYLPRFVDRLVARNFIRGVSPYQIRFGFGPWYSDVALMDRGAAYIESRKRLGMSATKRALLTTGARALVPLRLSIGLMTPTIAVWLRKGSCRVRTR
jgi:2-polyprenyl-3-methyl-5-hydroxy-6-metoxy-1,4-benzoquinol methylase